MPDQRRLERVPEALTGSSDESALVMRGISLAQTYKNLPSETFDIAWSADGTFIASDGDDSKSSIWSTKSGNQQHYSNSTNHLICIIAWHPFHPILAAGSGGGRVFLWNAESNTRHEFCELDAACVGLAWAPDGSRLLTAKEGRREGFGSVELWDTQTRESIAIIPSLARNPFVRWSPTGEILVSLEDNGDIDIRSSDNLHSLHKLSGHTGSVNEIDVSCDGRLAMSGSVDHTVRVWDLTTRKAIATLEGHRKQILSVKFSPHSPLLASLSEDQVRLWRYPDWECVATISRNLQGIVGGLAFHPTQPLLAVKNNETAQIDCFSIDYRLLTRVAVRSDSRRYINAKVMLLGDTGVGKSGLALVLSGHEYERTDSTHGRRVWPFDDRGIDAPEVGQQTREVLLWDLAGQPGYRLVHQLHLNEVAVALLVFDSRSETDPFAGVKHWARALVQARRLEDTTVPLHAYLVAARADRGGVAVSPERIQVMVDDLALDGFFETSAKEGWQITELADAIRDSIAWDDLPMVSSSALFESIKQFLLDEKQAGRVLCTADDLFRAFLRMRPDESDQGELRDSFETCIGRVESRDLIRRLRFGGLVLLQPELLDAYASAMVMAAKDEPDGLGFIREDDALSGHFRLSDDERIGDLDQEKLLLIATVEELLRHEIALKETTNQGVDLIFPSQFTKQRPDAPNLPGRKTMFAFDGPLQSIYASLAVRLTHSSVFQRQTMWQNAAAYTTAVGGSCGIHLRELEEGRGELTLFYDDQADPAVRSQFETYVAEHLQQRAIPGTVVRHAILSCPLCTYVLPDELIQGKLSRGMTTIRCPMCEESVIPLRDEEPSTRAEATVSEMNRNADERRDLSVAATQIKGKIKTRDYDVFLCYNSKDRAQVTTIAEKLKERGILPWLDIWDIPPGARWQTELQRIIKEVESAAVFIGSRGTGPWQDLEVDSILQQFLKHKRPIIPVILTGRVGNPRLPGFLSSRHIVDMRNPSPDPLKQLIWGITGEKLAYM